MAAVLRPEVSEFLSRLRERSMRMGIPSIGVDDGLALYSSILTATAGQRRVEAADLGAGMGYSTAWMALALEDSCEESVIHAVERDPQLAAMGKRVFEDAPFERVRVEWTCGDAIDYLAGVGPGALDVAFVDIDKHLYPRALRMLEEKLRVGGLAIFHNALLPPPPKEFYEEAVRGPWKWGIAPTRLGLAILVRVREG